MQVCNSTYRKSEGQHDGQQLCTDQTVLYYGDVMDFQQRAELEPQNGGVVRYKHYFISIFLTLFSFSCFIRTVDTQQMFTNHMLKLV